TLPLPPYPTLFPYTTLFRSEAGMAERTVRQLQPARLVVDHGADPGALLARVARIVLVGAAHRAIEAEQGAHGVQQRGLAGAVLRSEEHTSELQSRGHLVCRL